MFKKRYKNDIILIGVILLFALITFMVFKLNLRDGNKVIVIVDNKEKYCYNFNNDIELEIKSGDGINVLVIENGQAYIKSANCHDKICVAHRKISKNGETIVCLPHRVVIEITEE